MYQKTIKTLLAKLNAGDATRRAEVQRAQYEEEEKEREKAEDQQLIESLEEEVASLGRQLEATMEDKERGELCVSLDRGDV